MKARAARYRLDDLLVDVGARRVMRGEVDLRVTGLSFDLLLALGQAAPDLLSVDALVERVWPGQVVSTETITQRIKMLRQSLGDSAAQPRYVASRRGYGYRLLSPMVLLPAGGSPCGRDGRAFELYVQARAIVRGTRESKDEALRFLDQALIHDPQFAPALAYRALLLAGSVSLTGAPRSLLARAEQDAVRALALDADLPDAHVARGLFYADYRRWSEAQAQFEAARAFDPADAFVSNLFALSVLRPTGQISRARAQLNETYRTVPADGFTLHELILTCSLQGDDAETSRYAHLSRTLSGIADPPWDVTLALARADARRRRFAEAAAHATRALPAALRDDGGPQVVETFYAALADPSHVPRACAALDSFAPRLEGAGIDSRTRAFFVTAFAMLGVLDAAYALIDRLLFTAGAPCSVELSDLWLPEMRGFRSDPRFGPLVHRLGLTDYWRRHGPPDGDPRALHRLRRSGAHRGRRRARSQDRD